MLLRSAAPQRISHRRHTTSPEARENPMTFFMLAFVESVLISGAVFPQGNPASAPVNQDTRESRVVIDSAALARFIDPLITAQMAKENIPGAVFILVQNGRVLY